MTNPDFIFVVFIKNRHVLVISDSDDRMIKFKRPEGRDPR